VWVVQSSKGAAWAQAEEGIVAQWYAERQKTHITKFSIEKQETATQIVVRGRGQADQDLEAGGKGSRGSTNKLYI